MFTMLFDPLGQGLDEPRVLAFYIIAKLIHFFYNLSQLMLGFL